MTPRILAAAAAMSILPLLSGAALAGSCPKDKVLTEPRSIESKDSVDVERETLAIVKLTGWRGLNDLFLRTRRLTIGPHGVIPTHTHEDRPSIVYIVSGELVEHSTFCSVPIVHKAGEWTPEFGPGHGHWWENKTDKPAVVTSSDVVDQETINLDLPKGDM